MALSQPTSTPTSQSLQLSSHISSDHLTSSSSSPQRPASFALAATSSSKDLSSSSIRSVPSLSVPSSPTSTSHQHPDAEHHHDRPNTLHKYRQSTIANPATRQNRGGLFNLAALAREKTSSAIAGLAEPSIRSRRSSGSLYRTAQSSPVGDTHQNKTIGGRSGERIGSGWIDNHSPRTGSTPLQNSSHARSDTWTSSTTTLLETDPPSQAYSNTASDTPAPIVVAPQATYHNMHQTSSRLLRMTSDERPFTRVHISSSSICVGPRLIIYVGLQRSVFDLGCQLTTSSPPCAINSYRALLPIRRGYQ
jgi:hypothetical protein